MTTTRIATRFCVFSPVFHIAQDHGANVNGRNFPEVHDPVRGRNRRKEDAEKLAESHADRSNGSGLNHQKERPAVKKSPQRPQGFAQIDILAAGARHHGRQFAVTQRADDGQKAGDQPGPDQQRRRIDLAAISAETIKMPEPIMEPMTSMVALVRPRPFTNSLS